MSQAASHSVDILLELAEPLARSHGEGLGDVFEATVRSSRPAVGLPDVPVRCSVARDAPRVGEVARWRLNDRLLTLPESDVLTAWRAAVGVGDAPSSEATSVLDRLVDAPVATVREVLADAALAMVERSPSALLRHEDVAVLRAGLPSSDGIDVGELLRALLDRGGDLGRLPAAAAATSDLIASAEMHEAQPWTCSLAERVLESIVQGAVPEAIEIHAGHDCMRRLAVRLAESDAVPTMRSELRAELGIPLPSVELVVDEAVPPDCIRVRVGTLLGPPRFVPPPGYLVVDATADELAGIDVVGVTVVHPATGRQAVLVTDGEAARTAGYGIADEADIAVLIVKDVARVHAHRLVTVGTVERLLDGLALEAPRLVQAIRARWDNESVSSVVSRLVWRTGGIGPPAVWGHALGDMASGWVELDEWTLRRAVAAYTASRASEYSDSAAVPVYLLDPEWERDVSMATDPDVGSAAIDLLVAGYVAEVAELTPRLAPLPLLVGDSAHAPIQDALRLRAPRARTLAYCDLPAGRLIQPVARVSAP